MRIELNCLQFRRSILPVTQEVLMPMTFRFRMLQGQLFTPPPPQPNLPPEARQRVLRLLARMMNEHLEKNIGARAQAEVSDE